jgi:hypothetical protein
MALLHYTVHSEPAQGRGGPSHTLAQPANVIENLKRRHGLPRIHLCGKTVYLTDSVKAWLEKHVAYGQ